MHFPALPPFAFTLLVCFVFCLFPWFFERLILNVRILILYSDFFLTGSLLVAFAYGRCLGFELVKEKELSFGNKNMFGECASIPNMQFSCWRR